MQTSLCSGKVLTAEVSNNSSLMFYLKLQIHLIQIKPTKTSNCINIKSSVEQHKLKENNIIAFNRKLKAHCNRFWVICCTNLRERISMALNAHTILMHDYFMESMQ